ncbi:MAG: hypothetical protein ABGZ17_21225 [Planctomycetaceae bacterium]
MTDDAHSATSPEPLFSDAELEQLDADDANAGRVLGKLLSVFFLYTILAMSAAACWTYLWTKNQAAVH